MTSLFAWLVPADEDERLVRRDQLMMSVTASRRIYAPLVAGILGVGYTALQWNDPVTVALWVVVNLAIQTLFWRVNVSLADTGTDARSLWRATVLHLGLSGFGIVCFATIGPLFWEPGSGPNHLFVLLTLTIAAAVAIAYSAAHLAASALNLVYVAMTTGLCVWEGSASYINLSVLGPVIGAILVAVALSINETATAMLKLRSSERRLVMQLREANQAKSTFLANMSHELRTPLNAVIGFSDMIRSEALGPIGAPGYVSFAQDIHVSGAHLLSLINDILDLSKIDAGKFELDESEVDLAEVVHEAQRIVALRAAQGGVRLLNEMPTGFIVMGDERALRQVALNVTMNAIKFTPPGGTVSASLNHEPGGPALLVVSDSGCGIASEDLERVFEPFGQASGQTAPERGTGLGLPIVRSLMRAHGGDATLQSRVGQGTRVLLHLPAERVAQNKTRLAA